MEGQDKPQNLDNFAVEVCKLAHRICQNLPRKTVVPTHDPTQACQVTSAILTLSPDHRATSIITRQQWSQFAFIV